MIMWCKMIMNSRPSLFYQTLYTDDYYLPSGAMMGSLFRSSLSANSLISSLCLISNFLRASSSSAWESSADL